MRYVLTTVVGALVALAPAVATAQQPGALASAPASAPAAAPTHAPPGAPAEAQQPQPVAPALATPAPAPGTPSLLPVQSKFNATFYGFVEGDTIFDTTQSFVDLAGNGNIARGDSYAGNHQRFQDTVRNSRLGFKLHVPDMLSGEIKTNAVAEMDFFGNQPPVSEGGFYGNPTFRVRHFYLSTETPWGTLLVGQTWQLFGWQSTFQPTSVQIQGIPAEIYSRTQQIRYTYGADLGAVRLDLALAMLRPAERDNGIPDGTAAIKLSLPGYKGWTTNGSTGSGLQSAALGVSALGRRFVVPADVAKFTNTTPTTNVNAGAIAVDVLVPIIPATKASHANATTLTAEYSRGSGDADMFTGLSFGSTLGGAGMNPPANPMMMNPAPSYTSLIDSGLVGFDTNLNPHAIEVQSWIAGLQYYAPNDGKEFIAVNYGQLTSPNLASLGYTATNKVWDHSKFFDASLFWDASPGVRFGLEYALFNQTYLDGVTAKDQRVQFSGFFIF